MGSGNQVGKKKMKTRFPSQEMPAQLHERMGQFDPIKRANCHDPDEKWGRIISFDALSNCNNFCGATHHCPYWDPSRPGEGTGKCRIQYRIIRSVMTILLNNYEIDEPTGIRIGLHLIPLYLDYARVCIELVPISKITLSDSKGKKYSHPLYKEKRELVKQIEMVWKSIGIDRMKRKNSQGTTPEEAANFAEALESGEGW